MQTLPRTPERDALDAYLDDLERWVDRVERDIRHDRNGHAADPDTCALCDDERDEED